MEIQKYLKKELWTRRLPMKAYRRQGRTYNGNVMQEMAFDDSPKQVMTQVDFLNELYPSSHSINMLDLTSLRPKYKYDKDKKEHEFQGFHSQYSTSIPLQAGIRRNKAYIAFGNDIWLGNESRGKVGENIISEIKAQYNITNASEDVLKMGQALTGTGDAAIVCYYDQRRQKIEVRTYSFEKGDVLNYLHNPYTNEEVGVRMFKFHGRKACELWKNETMELWIDDNIDSTEGLSLAELGFTKRYETSEDGFVKVLEEVHGLTESPFIYFRAKDVVWGSAQQNIEDIEKLISDILEAGKLSFYPIAFFKGGLLSLPALDLAIKSMGSKTTDGDAKFLEPPSISSSITFVYDKLMKSVFDATGTVMLHPDELKGQNDSSAYLNLLYQPEIIAANEIYAEQADNIEKFLRVFKKNVGIMNGNLLDYENFDLSYKIIPKVPLSEASECDVITKYVSAGVMSIRTATEEIDRSNPNEYERLQQQKKENETKIDEKIVVEEE